jgi:hypothetical protein
MVSVLVSSVVDHHYPTDELMIYHTREMNSNPYPTDEPMIYHTREMHANHYPTDEPMI